MSETPTAWEPNNTERDTFEDPTNRVDWMRHTNCANGPGSKPEGALLLAILADAIDCYRHSPDTTRGRREKAEARRYIAGHATMIPLFSFDSICSDILGVDPDRIRKAVLGKARVRRPAKRYSYRVRKQGITGRMRA